MRNWWLIIVNAYRSDVHRRHHFVGGVKQFRDLSDWHHFHKVFIFGFNLFFYFSSSFPDSIANYISILFSIHFIATYFFNLQEEEEEEEEENSEAGNGIENLENLEKSLDLKKNNFCLFCVFRESIFSPAVLLSNEK